MPERASIVIPARDEERNIRRALTAVRRAIPTDVAAEIIVVDGGSDDGTVAIARELGARVVQVDPDEAARNPARLRNRGAAVARGEILVFLDADCEPHPGWLEALLAAHERGWNVVGGAFSLPPGLPPLARCDYYAGWYNVHEGRPAGPTVSAPPGNLSIDAATFRRTSGFDETPGVAYSHEELRFQAELRSAGIPVYFEPAAVVLHYNRPGLSNLLARHYRWGYGALQSKVRTGAARFVWAYRYPWSLTVTAVPLAIPLSFYVLVQWLRSGFREPLAWFPMILATRLAYGLGMTIGGTRWLLAAPRLEQRAEAR